MKKLRNEFWSICLLESAKLEWIFEVEIERVRGQKYKMLKRRRRAVEVDCNERQRVGPRHAERRRSAPAMCKQAGGENVLISGAPAAADAARRETRATDESPNRTLRRPAATAPRVPYFLLFTFVLREHRDQHRRSFSLGHVTSERPSNPIFLYQSSNSFILLF